MFFFFSSRRRHTRLQGDWSSDVCSSDLRAQVDALHGRGVDVDLVERARRREVGQVGGADLERDVVALRPGGVEVGAHGRLDDVSERAQEEVLAQRLYGVEALDEAPAERRGVPGGALGREASREAREEEARRL